MGSAAVVDGFAVGAAGTSAGSVPGVVVAAGSVDPAGVAFSVAGVAAGTAAGVVLAAGVAIGGRRVRQSCRANRRA